MTTATKRTEVLLELHQSPVQRKMQGSSIERPCGKTALKTTGHGQHIKWQYQSVFTQEEKGKLPVQTGDPSSTMPKIEVSVEGVCKLLQQLNP